jgi:hypothetical protein
MSQSTLKIGDQYGLRFKAEQTRMIVNMAMFVEIVPG